MALPPLGAAGATRKMVSRIDASQMLNEFLCRCPLHYVSAAGHDDCHRLAMGRSRRNQQG